MNSKEKKSKKKIKRNCVICGKKMSIKIDKQGKYNKGYYFGRMKLPIKGTGKYVKTGTFRHGKLKGKVVKWTGKNKEIEYWECKKCFKED